MLHLNPDDHSWKVPLEIIISLFTLANSSCLLWQILFTISFPKAWLHDLIFPASCLYTFAVESMSRNQPKHPQHVRTFTKINCQPDDLMKRLPRHSLVQGELWICLFPSPQNSLLTVFKKVSGLLLQNKIKKVTLVLLSQTRTVVTWNTGIIKSNLHCDNLEVLGRMGFIIVKFHRYSFFCHKGIQVPEGKIGHLFSRHPHMHTASWLSRTGL